MDKPLLKYGLMFLAAGAPCAALFAAVGDRACAPFGWNHWIVLHVVATLPLAWLVAALISRLFPGVSLGAWVFAGAGVLLALLAAALGAGMGAALDAGETGFGERAFMRIILCIVLVLPWMLAVERFWPDATRNLTGGSLAFALALATVAAVALPLAYERHWINRHTAVFAELIDKQRLVAAADLAARLADVGSGEWLPMGAGGRRLLPARVARDLDLAIRELARRVQLPLPQNPPVGALLARASDLAALGDFESARKVVRGAADDDPRAAIMVAGMLQEQGRWHSSDLWCRKAIDQVRRAPESVTADDKNLMLRSAYSDLASNARSQGRFREAETIYREAIAAVPAEKAHFLFELGEHYRQGGRPAEAMHNLSEAARLAPERYAAQARTAIEALRTETPACLLLPPR